MQAPGERRTGGFGLPAPHLAIFFAEDRVHGKPAHGARDPSGAIEYSTAREDSRSDTCSYGEKNHILQSARRPQPLLAHHIARAVTIDGDRNLESAIQFGEQRNMSVTPQVWRPCLARTLIEDAGGRSYPRRKCSPPARRPEIPGSPL